MKNCTVNGSENFPGELQITLQLGSRWAFEASDYHEKLHCNGSENFPGELQITLQLGSRWAFEASY